MEKTEFAQGAADNAAAEKKSNGKGKGKGKAEKKLLTAFEFSRAGSIAIAIGRVGNWTDEKKIVAMADKIYQEKTGTPLNPKESKWNYLYACRFLKHLDVPKLAKTIGSEAKAK